MIFGGGFVHCDPHPGNVLARPVPSGGGGGDGRGAPEVQLVLLDHGLYRELPRHFTMVYARLWHGLVLGDADEIREQAEAMGVGRYYPLLAAMLTARPWNEYAGLGIEPRRSTLAPGLTLLMCWGLPRDSILQAAEKPKKLVARGTKEDQAQIAGYAAQYAKQSAHACRAVAQQLSM